MAIIELTPFYGLKIAVCRNAEVLNTGDRGTLDEAEAVEAAVGEVENTICDLLGDFPRQERSFRAWNGGWCAKADFRDFPLAANAYMRTLESQGVNEDDYLDELEYSGWEYRPLNKLPVVIRRGIEAIMAAAVAMQRKE